MDCSPHHSSLRRLDLAKYSCVAEVDASASVESKMITRMISCIQLHSFSSRRGMKFPADAVRRLLHAYGPRNDVLPREWVIVVIIRLSLTGPLLDSIKRSRDAVTCLVE